MAIAAAESIVAWQSHEGVRLSQADGLDVIECLLCGFRHVVPLPDPQVLEATYREAYYRDEKPTFLAHAAEDQSWAALGQNDRLDVFERLLPPSRRRLLDIGCGPGFFLKTALARGWQTLGIEPSRQAAAHARALGVNVAEGFFDARSAPALGRFDAIQLNNVLEHVPDPAAILTEACALLDAGGIICVSVPNDYSPFQIAARAAATQTEWWVAPKHHLNYFDFASLANMLERLGLKVAERSTGFPMEIFLLMGDNYTVDPALGRACHEARKKFDLALETASLGSTRRKFYRALAEAGLGREAAIIAVKP
ncbi:MAG TPA: class I SAM-dependent methyltransferase [Rhizomicrobium sp.]|nr:class I SAM-dependent methyltransferase [Rhizomicrobium sp.]